MQKTNILAALLARTLLSACALDRANDAEAAKPKMLGMNREEVLACMGIPKKKASEGITEVWSYLSTDRHGESAGRSVKDGIQTLHSSTHDANFCTVNIVIKSGVVSAIYYNGSTSSTLFAEDDECVVAVKNCVEN